MLTIHLNPSRPVERLAEIALAHIQADQHAVLIVPEQLSHEAERALGAIGGAGSCLRAEVLSFTRLAQRFFSIYGGAARKRLDGAGRVLAMALATDELRPRIKYFAGALSRADFLKELLQAVDEFKACCIDPRRLREAAAGFSGESAQKMEELCLILEGYAAVCERTAYDPRDDLTNLAMRLYEEDYADSRVFFVAGFQDFTAQELAVLEALLRRGAQVQVLLACDTLEEGASCYDAARRTGRQLRALAGRIGSSCETRHHEADFFPEQAHLLAHLYDGADVPWTQPTEALQLLCAADLDEACRNTVEEIYREVLSGARYHSIGVAVCDLGAGLPKLKRLLASRDIPFYCAGRSDVCARPIFALVLSTLEAVSYGYRREQVIATLRTGLTGLQEEEIDLLENYAISWNVRGRRWTRCWTEHPDGYDGQMDDAAEAKLEVLNLLRQRAIEPLLKLERGLKSASRLADQAICLYEYINELGVGEKLEQICARLIETGRSQMAQEEAQLYTVLVQALEQLHALGTTAARSMESFYRLLQLVLGQYDVASIPAALDTVTIGSLEDLRSRSFDTILVIGAQEGLFPAFAREQSLLTQAERADLRRGGLQLPDPEQLLDRGIATVSSVLASAKQRLWISASEADQPSYLFSRACRLFPQSVCAPKEMMLSDFATPSIFGAMAAPADAPELPQLPQWEQVRFVRDALRKRAEYQPGILTPDAVRAIYGTTLRLSPSRIDRLASCRYGYFLEYGLRLKERRTYQFDAPIFGTFVHAVLEQTVRAVEDLGGFSAVSDEQVRTFAQNAIDGFTRERLDSLEGKEERFIYLYERNREEVLGILESMSREMRKSDFHACAFELRFAPGGELPAIEVQGSHARGLINGVVDRVDLAQVGSQEYLRIVDYKTGRKELDYTDLSIGVGLQLLIYVFALEELGVPGVSGKPELGGVLYIPAREAILSAPHRLSDEEAATLRRKESRRSGLLTDHEAVLQAMEYGDEPEFMPYQNTKNGRKGDLADEAQWKLLKGHVNRTLGKFVDEVACGMLAPNPYARGQFNSCTWCAYASVCRFSSGGGCFRNYEKIKPAEFWAERKEEQEHG